MIRELGSRLAILGHIGYDVYLAADDRIYVRPAGSAYNAACGILATGGEAMVLASTSPSFNLAHLAKFERTRLAVRWRLTRPGPEHVWFYDLRPGQGRGEAGGELISLGAPARPPLEELSGSSFQDHHVHLGTMPPGDLHAVWEEVRRAKPGASLSCNLYAPYLGERWPEVRQVLASCAIVFLNFAELVAVRRHGRLRDVFPGKLVVVSRGGDGAVAFVDETPVFAHTPEDRPVAVAVGAGDVLAGAFLSVLVQTRDVARALATAVEASAATVSDYGVDGVLLEQERLRREDFAAGAPPTRIALLGPAEMGAEPAAYSPVVEATAAFVVREGRLLVARKPDELAFRPGLLYVPGGKAKPGESPEECARRELAEETGIAGGRFEEVAVFLYPDPKVLGRLYRFHEFLVTGTAGDAVPADDISECLWVPLAEIERGQVFALTWAQLLLLRWTGRWR